MEPIACTPAAGWEKGQVENQVGLVRERFFTPRLRVTSYEELNAWLLDRCVRVGCGSGIGIGDRDRAEAGAADLVRCLPLLPIRIE